MFDLDPMTLSQIFIDVYYDYKGRKNFIVEIKRRFPQMDNELIEAIWLVINFMEAKLD